MLQPGSDVLNDKGRRGLKGAFRKSMIQDSTATGMFSPVQLTMRAESPRRRVYSFVPIRFPDVCFTIAVDLLERLVRVVGYCVWCNADNGAILLVLVGLHEMSVAPRTLEEEWP